MSRLNELGKVRLLRQNNVGVVIHDERDFNTMRIPHEQENGLNEALRKEKGKMPMGKENVASMNGKNKASSKEKGKAPMDRENIALMDSNNSGISKAAQAQCARREREKLLAVRIPHEQENGLKEALRKGKGKMPTGKENVASMVAFPTQEKKLEVLFFCMEEICPVFG